MNIYERAKKCVFEINELEKNHDPQKVKCGDDDPLLSKWENCIAGHIHRAEAQADVEGRARAYSQLCALYRKWKEEQPNCNGQLAALDAAMNIVFPERNQQRGDTCDG